MPRPLKWVAARAGFMIGSPAAAWAAGTRRIEEVDMRAAPRRFKIGLLWALVVLAGNTTRGQTTTTSLSQMSYTGITWFFNVAYDCFPCFGSTFSVVITPWSTPAGSEPTWSPDATEIAFASGGDIWITSPAVDAKRLTGTHNNANPAWAPDGGQIAFVSSRDGRPEIYVMNPDGSGVVRLTSNLASKIGRPAWSPDSGRIAFNCEVDLDNQDICIINRNASGFSRLTSDPATDVDPAWSPDGTKIAFSTARYAGATFAVMNPDGSRVTQIASGIAGWRAAWSPDGTRIAFAGYAPDSTPEIARYGIYSMTADGTDLSFLGGSGGGVGGVNADLIVVDGGALDPAWMPRMRAPVAVITAECTELTCSFDGSHSLYNSVNLTSYRWEFGDGETSAERTNTHTYAMAGTYLVRLTATDESGVTGSTTQSVTVTSPPNVPPSVAIVVPIAGAAFAALQPVGITATASDPNGTITSVRFYVGSSVIGTATVAPYTISWSAPSPGSYTLSAVATDNAGLSTTSASVTISVVTPPIAAFTYACLGLTCTLDGSNSQGEVTSYAWDFGDRTGTYSGGLVTHTYSRPGTYTVLLFVTNVIGGSTAIRDVTVRKK